MEKKIVGLSDIDYKTNAEGRLLFTALTILTTHNYPNKTPDEVVGILNEKSSFLDDIEKKDLKDAGEYFESKSYTPQPAVMPDLNKDRANP